MKKSPLSLALSVGLLFAMASCSDDHQFESVNDGSVTFNISVPDAVMSRANFGDGTTAQNNVQYYVYDQANPATANPVLTGKVTMTGLKGTVTLNLAKAHTYDIVFLATSSDSPYTYNQTTRVLNMNYSTTTPNNSDENLDAFFNVVPSLSVDNSTSTDVALTRPFAQLNIGTSDLTDYEEVVSKVQTTAVTVSNIYSSIDLMTGNLSGDPTQVTFAAAALPAGQTFPVTYTPEGTTTPVPYTYLAMDYLLVNDTKDIVTVTMDVNTTSGVTEKKEYQNIPVQRNYRTNIYGALLTSEQTFNVEILPGFAGNTFNDYTSGILTLAAVPTKISNRTLTETLVVQGSGILILDNATLAPTSGDAITLADKANVDLRIEGNVAITGAMNGNGITVSPTAALTLSGDNLVVKGNAGQEYFSNNGIVIGSESEYAGTGGSAIGGTDAAVGTIYIHDMTNLVAEGYGKHANGIGGNTPSIKIVNTTLSARGGYAYSDFKFANYGKNEPEGGAAIGFNTGNATVGKLIMNNVTSTSIQGGSKAAAIGSSYWGSADITITGCNLTGVTGGNASAAIGSGRQPNSGYNWLKVTIDNSTINCTGGENGAGIGSGYDVHCAVNNPNAAQIYITGQSNITAQGGKYAAGIGTGYHVAGLTGSIAGTATIKATSGTNYYKVGYTLAQNIGYGIIDMTREGEDLNVTFTVNGTVIPTPTIATSADAQ